MTERATYITAPPLRRRPSHRRWDITLAILALLESGLKTANKLRTEIRVGIKYRTPETAPIWETHPHQTYVHGCTLARHLHYLQRDGLVLCEPWLMILERGHSQTTWLVKLYRLTGPQGGATPSPAPLLRPIHVSKIHNPFKTEEDIKRYIRWLSDPHST